MAETHKADIPLSILDGSDGMFRVEFTYRPGADPSPRTMANPMGVDDGYPPEIEIIGAHYLNDAGEPLAPLGLAEHGEERAIEWLMENWEPPAGPDPDDLRDQRIDQRLTEGD